RHVHDDAATRVRGFAYADGQHAARNLEVLHRTRQRERIWWNYAALRLDGHKGTLVELLGIDYRRIDIGKNLELVSHAQVIAIGRQAVGDHALPHLLLGEGIDHVVLQGHLADPAIALQHEAP